MLINTDGILIGRYGVSTYFIDHFNLELNKAVPESLFQQIRKKEKELAQIEFDGQSFPISIEPSKDLYQITFLAKRTVKVA